MTATIQYTKQNRSVYHKQVLVSNKYQPKYKGSKELTFFYRITTLEITVYDGNITFGTI